MQLADGDVPWEINSHHRQSAPEILIMPKKGEYKRKVRNTVTLIIYMQQQSKVLFSHRGIVFPMQYVACIKPVLPVVDDWWRVMV